MPLVEIRPEASLYKKEPAKVFRVEKMHSTISQQNATEHSGLLRLESSNMNYESILVENPYEGSVFDEPKSMHNPLLVVMDPMTPEEEVLADGCSETFIDAARVSSSGVEIVDEISLVPSVIAENQEEEKHAQCTTRTKKNLAKGLFMTHEEAQIPDELARLIKREVPSRSDRHVKAVNHRMLIVYMSEEVQGRNHHLQSLMATEFGEVEAKKPDFKSYRGYV